MVEYAGDVNPRNIETELSTDVSTEEDWTLLARAEGRIRSRKVVRKIRLKGGGLQETYDWYYNNVKFHSTPWSSAGLPVTTEDGEHVISGPQSTERPIEQWVESNADDFYAEMTDLWGEVIEQYDMDDILDEQSQ